MEWYLKVLRDFGNFRDRSRRKEYWMFVLFNMLFAIVAAILDNIFGTTFKFDMDGVFVALPYGYIYLLYVLIMIIPSIAVGVRRLHDVGKSGWFYFIVLIPIVGAIWLLVLFCTDGQIHTNAWGPNPKGNFDDYIGFKTESDNLQ